MAHRLGHETKFALRKILPRTRKDRVRAAHVLDVLLAALDRRQRIEIDRVGVVPAEIFLIDRLHIMPDMAVVTAAVPRALEARRQFYRFCDLSSRRSVIHQTDGLVMRAPIDIAPLAGRVVDALGAPPRP